MEADKPKSFDSMMNMVPLPADRSDLGGFHFDELTSEILESVDSNNTVRQIIQKVGKDPVTVIERLNLLNSAGLVLLPIEQQTQPRHTLPAPSPASSAPAPPPTAEQRRPMSEETETSFRNQPLKTTTGSLEETDARTLVEKARHDGFTGSLEFEKDGDRIIFHFDWGEAKGVEAAAERHDYGTMLFQGGLITEEMLQRYRSSMARSPEPIYALREAGIPDRRRMAKLVTWRGQSLFSEVRAWSRGSFRITPMAVFPPNIARCSLKLLESSEAGFEGPGRVSISSGWRKQEMTEEQLTFLNENRNLYLVPTKKTDQIAAALNLDKKEKTYMEHVLEGSPMQIRRAMSISTLLKTITRKILLHMIEGGGFELSKTNPEGVTPIPLDEVVAYSKLLEKDDHFKVLHSHAVSTEEDIRERYRKRIESLEKRHFAGANAEQLEALDRIRTRIERAWQILGDDKSRREYRKSLYSQFQIDNYFNIQIDKAQSALTLLGRPKEALSLALSAWDLKPGNGAARTVIITSLRQLGRHKEAQKYEDFEPV